MTSIVLEDIQVSDCAINGETGADVEVFFDCDGDIEYAVRLDTYEEHRLTPRQVAMAYEAHAEYWQDLAEMHYGE